MFLTSWVQLVSVRLRLVAGQILVSVFVKREYFLYFGPLLLNTADVYIRNVTWVFPSSTVSP
jgi:hypothetical protein